MWQKNDGHNEADKLQNRFTAYISVAIQRRRNAYIMQAMRQQQLESLTENPVSNGDYDILEDVLGELPLLMQLENDKLLHALKELNERERQIFLARVLDEKSFVQIADEMGMKWKSVATTYYRTVTKLKELLKGDYE